MIPDSIQAAQDAANKFGAIAHLAAGIAFFFGLLASISHDPQFTEIATLAGGIALGAGLLSYLFGIQAQWTDPSQWTGDSIGVFGLLVWGVLSLVTAATFLVSTYLDNLTEDDPNPLEWVARKAAIVDATMWTGMITQPVFYALSANTIGAEYRAIGEL